jgi:hypothetical protein
MINWKGFERKRSWPNRDISAFLEGINKTEKIQSG